MKIPTHAMISIFSIPNSIKCLRWHCWERRYLFLDDKDSHGFHTAYQWVRGWFRQLEEKA